MTQNSKKTSADYKPKMCMTRPKMCNGQHQNVFGHHSSLWKKGKQGGKKKLRTKVQGPIPDLTSSILYLSCCVFNIIRLELKHEST
jgi:hypothetical protein